MLNLKDSKFGVKLEIFMKHKKSVFTSKTFFYE